MFIEAKLVFKYYIPVDCSVLTFLTMGKHNVPYVYSIEGLRDPQAYMDANGYPVLPWIIYEGNPNVPNSTEILAIPDQIGWFDAGSHTDDLVDIEVKHFNDILEFDNGNVLIEVDDETDDVVFFLDKVTLMYVDSLDYDDDEDDELLTNEDDDDYNEIY